MQDFEKFKVLGDLNRLRTLHLLFHDELCVCELEALLDMSQSNASRHLHKLKITGIAEGEKRGQWTYYRLADSFVRDHDLLYQYLKDKTFSQQPFIGDRNTLRDARKKNLISCAALGKTKEEKGALR